MKNSKLVYSTEVGRITSSAIEKKSAQSNNGDGIIRIQRQVGGRRGKEVTVAMGFDLDIIAMKALLSELKKKCGSGGTIKENTIEIQGNHTQLLFQLLTQQGFKVKLSGG